MSQNPQDFIGKLTSTLGNAGKEVADYGKQLELPNVLLPSLAAASLFGTAGYLATPDRNPHVRGETPEDRRRRKLRNAMIGAGLGGITAAAVPVGIGSLATPVAGSERGVVDRSLGWLGGFPLRNFAATLSAGGAGWLALRGRKKRNEAYAQQLAANLKGSGLAMDADYVLEQARHGDPENVLARILNVDDPGAVKKGVPITDSNARYRLRAAHNLDRLTRNPSLRANNFKALSAFMDTVASPHGAAPFKLPRSQAWAALLQGGENNSLGNNLTRRFVELGGREGKVGDALRKVLGVKGRVAGMDTMARHYHKFKLNRLPGRLKLLAGISGAGMLGHHFQKGITGQ